MAGPLGALGHTVSLLVQDTVNNRQRLELECPCAHGLFFAASSPKAEVWHKRRLVQEASPDVIYVCGIGVRNWVCRLRRGRRPIFLVEHSELRSEIASNSLVRRQMDRLLELSTLFLFDGQVCASRYLQRHFTRWSRRLRLRRPLVYSPYAYNSDLLLAVPKGLDALQRRYEQKKVLLYMGTLAINYGILDIFSAVDALRYQRQDFVLLVMGSGRHKNHALEFVAQRGLRDHVELLGYVPEAELPAYFRLAHAFLCPLLNTVQDWARCPSKLFMYLPFQKPIVTCRVGEAIELLEEEGFYYEPGNVVMLTATLDRALNNPSAWQGCTDPSAHCWQARTSQFLKWVRQNWNLNWVSERRFSRGVSMP